VAAIAAFGAAAEAGLSRLGPESMRLMRLRARIETRLRALFPDLRIHGEGAPRLANTVNLGFPGISGETLVIALDLAGFAVSTGSACASGAVEPSHVIRAMGATDEEARSAVRISLGWSTTDEEVERFLAALPAVVARAREASATP
jgi:cysteine desulfurase